MFLYEGHAKIGCGILVFRKGQPAARIVVDTKV